MRARRDAAVVLGMILGLLSVAQKPKPKAKSKPTDSPLASSSVSKSWAPDNGDGTYKNPVLHADYSDPDVVRNGKDFYMVASSFNSVPGLPILHSRDLVSWQLVAHALPSLEPAQLFDTPQHGMGVWAPSLRLRDGTYYVYYSDPDIGIFMVSAKDPRGPWTKPTLVKAAKGWIDPCPFWDEDGNAYLVNAFAASRTGVKSILVVNRLSADGKSVLDGGVLVFDGHERHPTVEGPKLHKRNGYYYISAPAGGVPTGWQLVLRSRNIYGPYEEKVVLAQGKTAVNGPHQGAWVDTPKGDHWFLHFQDRAAYGRVVHLQPMKWVDDWPVMGQAGEPVATFKKPDLGPGLAVVTPAESDEFNGTSVGLQWQWQANPRPGWAFPSPGTGMLRLPCIAPPRAARNLWDSGNLLLQKFPAPHFTVTARVTFYALNEGERTGLVVMGTDYAAIVVERRGTELVVSQRLGLGASTGGAEKEIASRSLGAKSAFLRARVAAGGRTEFSFGIYPDRLTALGEPFTAQPGRWVGAKVGLFSQRGAAGREAGYADYDWFRVE
jgi:beta-xylosidase